MSNLGESASQIINLTADATLADWGQTVLVDTTAGDVVVTLPSNTGKAGRMIEVKKTSSDVNTVTVEGLVLSLEDQAVTFRSDGTEAQVIQSPVADFDGIDAWAQNKDYKEGDIATRYDLAMLRRLSDGNSGADFIDDVSNWETLLWTAQEPMATFFNAPAKKSGGATGFIGASSYAWIGGTGIDSRNYVSVTDSDPAVTASVSTDTTGFQFGTGTGQYQYRFVLTQNTLSGPGLVSRFIISDYAGATHEASILFNSSNGTIVGTTSVGGLSATGSVETKQVGGNIVFVLDMILSVNSDVSASPPMSLRIQPAYNNDGSTTANPSHTGYIHIESIEYGLPSDFTTSGDFVSTKIDSNAGATTETLGASTNAGLVKLFTNIDVTNTATLAVQSGEALNGVTDGTFLFSNYSAGTQFRADEVTGGWAVSVAGVIQKPLRSYSGHRGGYTTPIGNLIPLSQLTTNTDDSIRDGNTVVIPEDGRYQLEVAVNVETTAAQLSIEINGGPILAASSSSGNIKIRRSLSIIEDLSAGDVIVFKYASNNAANIWNIHASVEQLPTTTVINALDTPVNDQAASGYMDVGTMRIQWGTRPNVGQETVTFPAPFADTNYVVNLTINHAGYSHRNASYTPTSTTGFLKKIIVPSTGFADSAPVSWQAIGLKP